MGGGSFGVGLLKAQEPCWARRSEEEAGTGEALASHESNTRSAKESESLSGTMMRRLLPVSSCQCCASLRSGRWRYGRQAAPFVLVHTHLTDLQQSSLLVARSLTGFLSALER